VRFGFPRRALVFGAVAAATSFWLVLEVAYNAAWADHPGDPYGTPRIHERYLIYVIPLILVAMVAGLRALRPRVGARAHLAIAAIAMLLPAAIPFTKVINYTLPADTFGLQIFGTVVHGNLQAISDARLVAVCIGAVFALAYLYALIRPRPSFAIVMTVVAFLILSLLVRIRIVTNAANSTAAASTPAAWIDAAAPQPGVTLISGPVRKRNAARDTAQLLYAAFDNLDVSRVYSTCGRVFGADFGERPLTAAGNGTLRDGDAPLQARYVVAPAALHIRGRVVARPADGSLELVKITTPAVTVARPLSCPS
jgi:hypothetical protein